MAFRDAIQAPDLPALERQALPQDGELLLSVALVEPDGGGSVSARRHGVLGVESLHGVLGVDRRGRLGGRDGRGTGDRDREGS